MNVKMILLLVGLGVASFAAAFGVSWFMTPAHVAQQEQAAAPTSQPSQKDLSDLRKTLAPKERTLDSLVGELRTKIDALAQREAELTEREKRLAIAQATLKQQAQELENLQMQLVAPLATLKSAQKELEASRVAVKSQELVSLRHTAAIYEKMDPSAGSKVLEGLCASNQEDDAVKILFYMSERAAANLMSEMTDKNLVAKLSEKMKRVREQG